MANARQLDRNRKSIANIRKITRTMELIATARFRRAMDRATAARQYSQRLSQVVAELAQSGRRVEHPLLEPREQTRRAVLLVLTANRGLCGGYNAGVLRLAFSHLEKLRAECETVDLEVSGKRGISAFKFRRQSMVQTFQQFDDQPKYQDVEAIADRYLESYVKGELDRVDVLYTRFENASRQVAEAATVLPLSNAATGELADDSDSAPVARQYELLPSAASILQEIIPASFRVRLFQCFLDAGVSEQIARMVAMKSATENSTHMIRRLSMAYNRARQAQITKEISEIIGGVEALQNG